MHIKAEVKHGTNLDLFYYYFIFKNTGIYMADFDGRCLLAVEAFDGISFCRSTGIKTACVP